MAILKQSIITSIGTALEYYDFVIYIIFIKYISQTFFPHGDPLNASLESLGVFAIGYFIRPIGGMIFGSIGDRFGRKKAFVSSIALMGIASIAIGLLPSYQEWGIVSSILLTVFRVLQGLAQGAELPGAITYISEHAYRKNRGFFTGIIYSSVTIGATLSTLTGYCITKFLTNQQILNWGWRLPFLIGGALSILVYYFRRQTIETPLFKFTPNHYPITYLFSKYKINCIKGTFIVLSGASLILLSLYLPSFLSSFYNYSSNMIFLSLTSSLFLSAYIIPFCGLLADYFGKFFLLKLAALFTLCFLYPLFLLLEYQNNLVLFTFMICYQSLIALYVASFPAYLAEIFPTSVRYTGISFCYNLGFSIASTTPLITTWLMRYIGKQTAATLIPLSFAFLVLVWPSKNNKDPLLI